MLCIPTRACSNAMCAPTTKCHRHKNHKHCVEQWSHIQKLQWRTLLSRPSAGLKKQKQLDFSHLFIKCAPGPPNMCIRYIEQDIASPEKPNDKYQIGGSSLVRGMQNCILARPKGLLGCQSQNSCSPTAFPHYFVSRNPKPTTHSLAQKLLVLFH